MSVCPVGSFVLPSARLVSLADRFVRVKLPNGKSSMVGWFNVWFNCELECASKVYRAFLDPVLEGEVTVLKRGVFFKSLNNYVLVDRLCPKSSIGFSRAGLRQLF